MSDLSLNISGKIDSNTVALYKSVRDAAHELAIPFVVVGASARDIVLHYGHNARIQRATADVDFGIQIPDWTVFSALKESLLKRGYSESRAQHRLISPENMQVDIVPFGQVEDGESKIAWPPDGDWVMSVLGFQEVCDTAEIVRIQDEPSIDIPVATPEGMAILKLIAWTDRTYNLRRKDSKDLLYLFTTYDKIPSINGALHENQDLMERYGWDIELSGAYQLGVKAKSITLKKTFDAIEALFNGSHTRLTVELLVEEMCDQVDREYDRNEALTNAFIGGFLGRK